MRSAKLAFTIATLIAGVFMPKPALAETGDGPNMLKLSCMNGPGNSTERASQDPFHVTLWAGNYLYQSTSMTLEAHDCIDDDDPSSLAWSFDSWGDEAWITDVIIQTHSDDALFLDWLELYYTCSGSFCTGNTISKYGVTGGDGWCLSTDANDASGWSNYLDPNAGCQEAFRFDVDNENAYITSPLEWVYTVKLDCGRSTIENEGTSNDVTVSLYDGSTKLGERVVDYARWCEYGTSWEFSSEKQPDRIYVETNGSDAMFIDYVTLWEYSEADHYDKIKTWGQDGGNGWCLSTDPSDSSGGWDPYVSGNCGYKLRFDTSNTGAVVYE
ncbi:hypothetical protein ENSA7_76470 [Enhygromyxa salina]|uniref:Uncharacterized protein n=2 Tax=Enhygromyxa salina TaxID=215803 RepID=A0A2S9XPN8_9BACT|nr:hypothetical protein ENSA7_76470 [Enhygromyxa salina]